jgi:phosphoglycerate dehydrogenase-like enzyme
MMVRVGVDAAIDDALLKNFTKQAQLVKLARDAQAETEIDFWIPLSPSPTVVQSQWSHLKGVRVVQAPWAGVDLVRRIFPPEIVFCDARGVHDIPTAEWAVAAVLAMQKYVPFYVELQKQGDWTRRLEAREIYRLSHGADTNPPALLDEVADSTILIVGYGSIGKAIEIRLAPFGPKFLRIARTQREGVEPVSKLDEFLPQADIAILILPLTSETRHLMDAKRLALMKPGALLVNAARGGIVESDALLQALNEKRLRAAIDVTDPEPLPLGHPLWNAPNLFITPHVAGDSAKFMKRLFTLASAQVERFAKGEPLLNVVTGEY